MKTVAANVAKSVRGAIEVQFPAAPVPPAPVAGTGDVERTTSAFLGRSWATYTARELLREVDSLCCFTPQAFRYYLPAFMVASLDEPSEVGVIPENIFNLLGWPDTAPELVAEFTPEQKKVVAEFIRAVADEMDWKMNVPAALRCLEA